MATLREYYDSDFSRVLSVNRELMVRGTGLEISVSLRLHFDHDANALFVSCYIPRNPHLLSVCPVVLDGIDTALAEKDQVQVLSGHPGAEEHEMLDSRNLIFTKRVFVYFEGDTSLEARNEMARLFQEKGLFLALRDAKYLRQRSSYEHPVAFISHDSRDKDAVAKPIALGLMKRRCPVWYDDFSLKVGDRLRESIEAGLKECHRCILILSSNFLTNDGWTKAEFDSVFTRELIERKDVILPVWHGVDAKQVYQYSPSLANRVALNWASGEEDVVQKLYAALVRANAV